MKKNVQKILLIFAPALIYLVLLLFGILNRPDKWIADKLFQRGNVGSGDVVIIGIDDDSLERLGAYNNWGRGIMASVVEKLMEDPENAPSVIAIDTLYAGNTDPSDDASLADACRKAGNVITACAGTFGTSYFDEETGDYKLNDHALLAFDEPYDELKDVTTQGHINAMYDMDGILRHAVLYFDVPSNEGDRRVYSMAYEAADAYAEINGMTIEEPKTDARGNFYVSYSLYPGGYDEGMNIADLLEGKIPADHYAGKIVLVGPYATGLQDEYFTPMDHAKKMFGVEVQANVIDAFLRGDYKEEMPLGIQLVIVFILTLVSFVLFRKLKLVPSSILCAILVIIPVIASVFLYDAGLIIHPIYIPVGVFAMYLVSIGIRYIMAAREKRRITGTFERYVSPEIVSEILKEGEDALKLGGNSCDIAVLFVDVRGFTTMSERLDPQKVVSILNKYLTMASDCVERHKGTLDKFVGDAMMAFWGAPIKTEDPVYDAVCTAMDIIEGAKRVSDELKEEMGEELNVGVGVNYGPAVVGNMGSIKHMDYTAIGDTVNTAARLEANAPKGTVYVSRIVADMLEGRIKTESLGDTVKLKGKAEGFEVLKVLELS